VHLGQREADAGDVRHVVEEGVVPARALRTALEDVPGDDPGGEAVPVVALPAELPRRGPEGQRGVRDARADDDVGAALERLDDAPRAEVRVRRHHLLVERGERDALVEVAELHALRLEHGDPRQEVVPLDVRDPRSNAELRGELVELGGEPGGIQAAGIDHDPDAARDARAEHLLHLPEEGARVAGVRALQLVAEEDHERQLGEVVARQHVDRAALDHLAGRAQPVAVEAAAVRDAEHVVRGHGYSAHRGFRFWAKACMPSAASSEAKSARLVAVVTRNASSRESVGMRRTSCFASRTAFGPPSRTRPATSSTARSSSAAGTARWTSPTSTARAAEMRSPVRKSHIAFWMPSFGMQTAEMMAGITPTRTSLNANAALSAAMVRSHAAVRPSPPPKACPLMRPITGFGEFQIVFSTVTNGCSSPSVAVRPPDLRSAPAQNAAPAPVSTTVRTCGSASAVTRW